jgi:ABC-type uncharacterized transport system permease subunit
LNGTVNCDTVINTPEIRATQIYPNTNSLKINGDIIRTILDPAFIFYNSFLILVFSFLGLLLGSIFKSQNSTFSISFLTYFAILFSSGAGVPIKYLPDNIINIVKYSPFTQMLNISIDIYSKNIVDILTFVLISIISFVIIAISYKKFKWGV